jgi:hypothetical protein
MGHQCGNCKKYGHGQMECGNTILIDQLEELYGKDELPYTKRCNIYMCKYRWSHSTPSHNCSKCNKNHGKNVCPLNLQNINYEVEYKIDCPICKVKNKIYKNQKKVNGIEDKCIICLENPIEIFLPNCGHTCICSKCLEDTNKFKDILRDEDILQEVDINKEIIDQAKIRLENKEKSYCIILVGQGCSFYIRKKKLDSPLEGFFMHGDMWGQYGPGCDDRYKLDYFVKGYNLIQSNL